MVCFKHSNERLGSLQTWELLDQLSDC